MVGPASAGRHALDALAAPYLAGPDLRAAAGVAEGLLADGVAVCLAGTPGPDDVPDLLDVAAGLAVAGPVAVALRVGPHDDPDRGCLATQRLPALVVEAAARDVAVRVSCDLGHVDATLEALAACSSQPDAGSPPGAMGAWRPGGPALTVDCRRPDAVRVVRDALERAVAVRLTPAELVPWARPRELAAGGEDWRSGLPGTIGRTHGRAHAADLTFVRALKAVVAAGSGPVRLPVVLATADPRLLDIAGALAVSAGRPRGLDEKELPWHAADAVLTSLRERGETVRVWLPYGPGWTISLARLALARPRTTVARTLGLSLDRGERRRDGRADEHGPGRDAAPSA